MDTGKFCLGCFVNFVIYLIVAFVLEHILPDDFSTAGMFFALAIFCFLMFLLSVKVNKPMWKSFICPHCFQKHVVLGCGVKTTYNNTTGVPSICMLSVKADRNGFITQNKDTCLRCNLCAKHYFCTVHPDKEIPHEYLKMDSFPIALLGAKASGKSNYIGVLVQELKHKMELPFNCSLTLDSSTASYEAYDKYYYQPLYKDGYTVMATEAGIEIPPLMFPLRFYKTSKETALMFYDTAGENLDYPDSMQLFNGYISYAQGIILLLDPLQIPEIRDALIAKGFTGLPEQNTETAKVLDAVIQVIRRVANQSGQINIPLALVVTKIDVLEGYNILSADSCLRTESEHLQYGKFVMPDYKRTHHEIEALIRTWLQGALMSYIRQFRYYAFFGVSALGVNPDGAKLGGDVKPRRVLDPLLWLLVKEKYVERVK